MSGEDAIYPMVLPTRYEGGVPVVTGINLRQHYAGAAFAIIGQGPNTSSYLGAKGMATKAVEYADALIAKLGEPKQ